MRKWKLERVKSWASIRSERVGIRMRILIYPLPITPKGNSHLKKKNGEGRKEARDRERKRKKKRNKETKGEKEKKRFPSSPVNSFTVV